MRRGLIEIRRGKGTFVLQPKITLELTELSGFVEDMQSLGRHASARLLDKQIVPASESVARHLAISMGTPVVRIQRVRLADNSPLSFDETWLPREIGERKILRQGNLNTEVEIYRYVTEGSFDAYMWQTLRPRRASSSRS